MIESEILSRLLYEPREIHEIELETSWFFSTVDKEIASALIENNGSAIDISTFCSELRNMNPHTEVSEKLVDDLRTEGFMIDNIKKKAALLKYLFYKSKLESASKRFSENPSKVNMMALQDRMMELEQLDRPEDEGELDSTVEEILRQLEEGSEEGILTYPRVDKTLGGGLHGGTLFTVGARPGVGKTAYAINLACQVIAKQKDAVIDFFTLEMSKEQMFKRFLSRMTEINSYKLRNPKMQLSDEEKAMILVKSTDLLETHLRIHDKLFNIKQIEKQIRRRNYEAKGRPYIAFIDYLGLIDGGNSQQPRHVQVGEITRIFKMLTNELNIPIILLSQLNRGIEARQDKKPNLSDLRDSGSVEQDSNVVAFLYKDVEDDSLTILEIAKNREGFTAEIPYRFFKGKMYFQEELA